MTSPAPGWYPDPGGTSAYRWWDGQAWTTATHPGSAATTTTQQATGVPIPDQAAAGYGAAAQPTSPQFGADTGASGGLPPVQPYGTTSNYSQIMGAQKRGDSLWHQNPHAMLALIVTAVYVVIAVTTPFGLIGIVPLVASIRSAQAGEKLGPLAVGAAVIALVVGLSKFAHIF
ncbi:MAG: DUF2510 domain-containing protein [Mycobacteriales bacterium]